VKQSHYLQEPSLVIAEFGITSAAYIHGALAVVEKQAGQCIKSGASLCARTYLQQACAPVWVVFSGVAMRQGP
jgi:hypothetical protein